MNIIKRLFPKYESKNDLRNAFYVCVSAKEDIAKQYDKLFDAHRERGKDLEQAQNIRERIIKTLDNSTNGIDFWIKYIVEWGKRKGWNEDLKEHSKIAEKLLLIVSELTEAFEETRNGRKSNENYVFNEKPEGFPIEIADACIRLFHLCGLLDIDLSKMIYIKMNYNEKRDYRHGGKNA